MKTRKKCILLILLLILLSIFTVLCSASISSSLFPEMNSSYSRDLVDAYVRESISQNKIPGIAVVIVKDGQIEYLAGYGVTNVNHPSPITPQTVFDLASCSKSFTALAVLLLENDGLLDLASPVVDYLPDLRFADPEVEQMMTVRDLLNHTSGLPGVFSEPMAFHQGTDAMTKLILAMKRVHINRPVGSSFEYSNMNYSLLGAIIESVSRKTFEDFIQSRIFSPLGMQNTTLYPEKASITNRASGHQLRFGQIVVSNIEIFRSAAPAGWVMSTAEDMARWLLLHLNEGEVDGKQIVPREIIQESHKPAIDFVEDGVNVSYGMGWLSTILPDETRVIWHGGDTPNFVAEMILIPEHDFGIAMLVNGQTSDNIHDIALEIVNLELGMELELPEAPWWAFWAAIDRLATGALGLSFIFLVSLVIFIYKQLRIHQVTQTSISDNTAKKSVHKIWRIALPSAPLALISMGVAVSFIFVQLYLGFNIFQVISRFGGYAPPGVMISAITLLIVIILWALALAGVSLLRLRFRLRTQDK